MLLVFDPFLWGRIVDVYGGLLQKTCGIWNVAVPKNPTNTLEVLRRMGKEKEVLSYNIWDI